eukprot:7345703-Prymnesium_polylepis.1
MRPKRTRACSASSRMSSTHPSAEQESVQSHREWSKIMSTTSTVRVAQQRTQYQLGCGTSRVAPTRTSLQYAEEACGVVRR